MDDNLQPGSPSPAASGPQDLQDRPALPAHPEWREIVVPWGQKAPKVLQGKMALPGPRDLKDLSEQTGLPEFPECPVYLVKWARPETSDPRAQLARQAQQARPERIRQYPAPRDPPVPREPMVPLARLAHKAPPRMPVLSGRPGRRVPPDQPVLTAQQAHQDHLAQMVNKVPQETLDRLVQLVQQDQVPLVQTPTTLRPSAPTTSFLFPGPVPVADLRALRDLRGPKALKVT